MRADVATTPKVSLLLYASIPAVGLGLYNGFFGPETGAFLVASSILLFGSGLRQATINAKPLNLVGNLIFLVFFLSASSSGRMAVVGW